MAKRSKKAPSGPRAPRRKTNSGERTQKDPVVVQQAPPKKVVEAIRELPEEPKVVVPVPAKVETEVIDEKDALPEPEDFGAEEVKAPDPFDHIDRKYFNDAWIEQHHANPADILSIFDSLKKQHTRLRALRSPGSADQIRIAFEKLEELRKILQTLGYEI